MSSLFVKHLKFYLFSIISTNFFIAEASVPRSATFKYVNEGDFGIYIVEYDATYRPLSPFEHPFQLCFYNTTPNAYTLALRMGVARSESLRRWVWEANRGHPVRENATLTFGTNGNLVLADSDGRIAWQTNTANKGVVGFKILENGNIVLYNSKGKFIWQSFDYPTDTLLVGQSLKLGGATKLVSRASEKDNLNGDYSLVLEDKTLIMYYKTLVYYSFYETLSVSNYSLEHVTFEPGLSLSYQDVKSWSSGSLTLRRPRYNTTLSFLRLEIDGNLRVYTYDDDADWSAWEIPFTLFSKNSWENECQLPQKCGNFGLCEDDQCVACPSPKGLLGWSKSCKPANLINFCGVKNYGYYELEGVDHFNSKYSNGNGPMKQDGCRSKCTKDCKCWGYFYHTKSSMCWIAHDLKTLTKVQDSTHLAFIKTPYT